MVRDNKRSTDIPVRAETVEGRPCSTDRNVRATQRGWIWAGFMLGFVARTLGAGALFWAVFPLWLALFWGVQGYPPTLGDLPRWYALGAFNAAPIVGMVLATPLVLGVLAGVRKLPSPPFPPLPRRGRGGHYTPLSHAVGEGPGVRVAIFSSLLYALLAPPLAYILLLIYAEMWQYRAWDAMTPTLLRAYLLLAPACGGVGALIGWTLKK